MVLISPMSTMIKNVTIVKIATYSRKIRLVLISACHSPRGKYVTRSVMSTEYLCSCWSPLKWYASSEGSRFQALNLVYTYVQYVSNFRMCLMRSDCHKKQFTKELRKILK